jgi:hypothetical protein
LIAIEPSLVAEREDKEPSKAPMGVRARPAIHTSKNKKKKWKRNKEKKKMGTNQHLHLLYLYVYAWQI